MSISLMLSPIKIFSTNGTIGNVWEFVINTINSKVNLTDKAVLYIIDMIFKKDFFLLLPLISVMSKKAAHYYVIGNLQVSNGYNFGKGETFLFK